MQDALDRLGFFVVLAMEPDVGHVQESRAIQADLDECRLHARQHAADLADIDVAYYAATGAAFDVQFLDDTLLHHRDPGFLRGDVDQDFLVHSNWKPKWASRREVSNIGSPTTPL